MIQFDEHIFQMGWNMLKLPPPKPKSFPRRPYIQLLPHLSFGLADGSTEAVGDGRGGWGSDTPKKWELLMEKIQLNSWE